MSKWRSVKGSMEKYPTSVSCPFGVILADMNVDSQESNEYGSRYCDIQCKIEERGKERKEQGTTGPA